MVKGRTKRRLKRLFSVRNLIIVLVLATIGASVYFFAKDIEIYDYIVETNAFFAPFEFYENRKIVGVDIEIINKVAEKLNAKIDIKNVEFDIIIDNVADGIIADAGAAGFTITPAREKKVNFSIPYYTSLQYVIYKKDEAPEMQEGYILWDALAGKILGSQVGSTGYIFMSEEVESGVLANTRTAIKGLDSHQLAADAISAHIVNYVIADELAAKFIVEKNPGLAAQPLYYRGENGEPDYPAQESYAIAVNKERPELLEAFNEVLAEMTEKDPKGISQIDRLIIKYMGLNKESEAKNE